jgi:acyl-CoA thioesterase
MTERSQSGTAMPPDAIRAATEPQHADSEAEGSLLVRLQRGLQTDSGLMPFGSTVGFSVELLREGEAVVVVRTDERHENIAGYTHGGVLLTIADTAIGLAHLGTLRNDETATTVEVKMNFLRPAWHTELRAHARMVKRGQLLSLLECDVCDQEGRLVARASGTMMTLPEDQKNGRSQFLFEKPDSA